jgi:hypothetical protein
MEDAMYQVMIGREGVNRKSLGLFTNLQAAVEFAEAHNIGIGSFGSHASVPMARVYRASNRGLAGEHHVIWKRAGLPGRDGTGRKY